MRRRFWRRRRKPPPEELLAVAQRVFDLDPQAVEALAILIGTCPLFEREGDSVDEDTLSKLGLLFAVPGVAEASTMIAMMAEPVLHDLARRVATGAADGYRAGAFLALARHEDAGGRVVRAEAMVEEALKDDPDFPPAIDEAAAYASDRGDAARAYALMRRAGIPPDDPYVRLLHTFAYPPHTEVPRNAPCPCGSGKKYKLCCLKDARHPLERRAEWLVYKIARWAYTELATTMTDLAGEMFDDEPDFEVLLEVAVRDTTILDAVVFDEGLLESFFEERGELLPPDELALAESWMGTQRSAFEVAAVTPGRVTVRDLMSGRELDVDDREGWRDHRPSDILFGRVVSNGRGHLFFGAPTVVPRAARHSLVAMLESGGEWEDIVAWRRSTARPPHVTNREGEDLVMCSATYHLPGGAGARAALGRVLRDDGDGRFVSEVDVDGDTIVRGWVSVEGDKATVEANSVVRFERIKDLLQGAVPDARVEAEERRPLDELGAEAGDRPALYEVPPPEVLEALDSHIADYERRWIEMPIPALGGATPRQAADDPRLRGELEALLSDFEWTARHNTGPGRGMDADRIRALLGMP